MDLHRTTKQPDWKKTSASEYSVFQKVAASTNGIITPANVVTLIGFAVVVAGLVALLQKHYWLGLFLMGFGRLFDIADGFVAQATHTKSPVGEMLDAVVDKVGTFLTLIVLVAAHITSVWVITALIIPQVIISSITLYNRRLGRRMHPSRSGKLSMFAAWTAIVGVIALKALEEPLWLTTVTYGFVVASLAFGIYAVWLYAKGRY